MPGSCASVWVLLVSVDACRSEHHFPSLLPPYCQPEKRLACVIVVSFDSERGSADIGCCRSEGITFLLDSIAWAGRPALKSH